MVNKKIASKIDMEKLDKKDKVKLFSTIRYGFLSHAQLMELSVDPLFKEAKELIK